MSKSPASRLFVALDTPTGREAMALVEQLLPVGVTHFKVGMSLFYSDGLPLVQALQARGCTVFVDLKLHDIPNTVARTTAVLVRAGVSFLNVHALGGAAMMRAAAEAAQKAADETGQPPPTLLAVTVLTSHSPASLSTDLKVAEPLPAYVSHLALLARESGMTGVVCSPEEVAAIRAQCGDSFVTVTPGIRPAQGASSQDDQARIATPSAALSAGAHYLVVGRPILQSPEPVRAAEAVLAEIAQWQTVAVV